MRILSSSSKEKYIQLQTQITKNMLEVVRLSAREALAMDQIAHMVEKRNTFIALVDKQIPRVGTLYAAAATLLLAGGLLIPSSIPESDIIKAGAGIASLIPAIRGLGFIFGGIKARKDVTKERNDILDALKNNNTGTF